MDKTKKILLALVIILFILLIGFCVYHFTKSPEVVDNTALIEEVRQRTIDSMDRVCEKSIARQSNERDSLRMQNIVLQELGKKSFNFYATLKQSPSSTQQQTQSQTQNQYQPPVVTKQNDANESYTPQKSTSSDASNSSSSSAGNFSGSRGATTIDGYLTLYISESDLNAGRHPRTSTPRLDTPEGQEFVRNGDLWICRTNIKAGPGYVAQWAAYTGYYERHRYYTFVPSEWMAKDKNQTWSDVQSNGLPYGYEFVHTVH